MHTRMNDRFRIKAANVINSLHTLWDITAAVEGIMSTGGK